MSHHTTRQCASYKQLFSCGWPRGKRRKRKKREKEGSQSGSFSDSDFIDFSIDTDEGPHSRYSFDVFANKDSSILSRINLLPTDSSNLSSSIQKSILLVSVPESSSNLTDKTPDNCAQCS